ncbi:hypothetical protein AS94_12255 [Staphylococcus aureus subsp. aureus 300-169]|nr:hypothetical protein AS94_12255 [Staphylococcus aureus subsp. aureus 300-169]
MSVVKINGKPYKFTESLITKCSRNGVKHNEHNQ